jgi:hypothetical protein
MNFRIPQVLENILTSYMIIMFSKTYLPYVISDKNMRKLKCQNQR